MPLTPEEIAAAQQAEQAREDKFIDNLSGKVAAIVARNKGDTGEAMELVLKENQKYRDRHRHDIGIIQQLRDAQPKDGGTILSKEEAKIYADFKALNLTVEQVTKLRDEHRDLTAKVSKADQEKIDHAAADALNLRGELLSELLTGRGMKVEMKEAIVPDPKDNTKTIKQQIPHIRPLADDKATPEPLSAYVERELKLYEPALRKDAGKDTGNQRARGADGRQQQSPARFPNQSASRSPSGKAGNGAAEGGDIVDRHISSTYASPIPSPTNTK